MFAVVMRIAILMAVLTAIYISLNWYLRWDRTRQLDDEYAAGDDRALTREDFIAKGMSDFDRSWQRKLLWGVYIIPILIALGIALLAETG